MALALGKSRCSVWRVVVKDNYTLSLSYCGDPTPSVTEFVNLQMGG